MSQNIPRTAGEMLVRSREFLSRKGLEDARLSAELLVAHALGLERLGLFMALDRPVELPEIARARDLVARRGRGEPVAYVIGRREFYGRNFAVGKGVLIPRPETELVVDRARELLRGKAGASVFDFGTGSGCIAITCALELERPEVFAADVSEEALAFAVANWETLGCEPRGARVDLVLADGFERLSSLVHERGTGFDLIITNPPYVEPGERASLAVDVREFEPSVALFAPLGDPDHFVRRTLEGARDWLAPHGVLLCELGAGQRARVDACARAAGFEPSFIADLEGIPRVLEVANAG